MALKIADKKLHKRVFDSMDRYDKLAIKYYKAGDSKKGRFYEKKSDSLYGKNYGKIFGVKKVNGRWVKVK